MYIDLSQHTRSHRSLLCLQDWGVVEHHNAMVFDLEVVESPNEKEETKVLDK